MDFRQYVCVKNFFDQILIQLFYFIPNEGKGERIVEIIDLKGGVEFGIERNAHGTVVSRNAFWF
ncbi:hypothetical protein L1766_07235 [Thermovorax subterraneus]|nr:hypothetical protein [Thermovorax subterraneus]